MDECTGLVFDYTRKQGVDHAEIIAPDDAPEWAHDRSKLWNAVEHSEKRKDSQVAREIEVALPVELNLEQQRELVRAFVKSQFVSAGMVADFAIHHSEGNNPHCHIMLTTRDIGPEGFGQKNRDWNNKDFLEQWREQWADHTNRALESAGSEARIDHRSLEAQGITDRAPGVHFGPAATGIVRRDESSEIANRAKQKADEFMALVQADAAILAAAELDIKELEAQLEKLRVEIKQHEQTQELSNVYFSHTPKPHTRRSGPLSSHGLRILSECDLAPNGADDGQGAENPDLLHVDERIDRSEFDGVRRVPEPAGRVEKMQEAQLDPVARMLKLRSDIDEYQSLHFAGPLEARTRALEARNRAHKRELVEKAHEAFTKATREHKRVSHVIKNAEDGVDGLPFWRPLKKLQLKKELEDARKRLAEQTAAIEKNRDMAHRPILDKCDLAIKAADAEIEVAQVGLEPLLRELQELEQQAAEQQAAREAEAARLAEEIRMRREEERAKEHAQRVAETRASPGYQAEVEARRRAAERANEARDSGPAPGR